MKVWSIKPHKEYSGGTALVAANTRDEANKFYFDADKFNKFMYDDYRCDIQLVKDLYYEGDKTIIEDTIYME